MTSTRSTSKMSPTNMNTFVIGTPSWTSPAAVSSDELPNAPALMPRIVNAGCAFVNMFQDAPGVSSSTS